MMFVWCVQSVCGIHIIIMCVVYVLDVCVVYVLDVCMVTMCVYVCVV